ncbi:hypothetical protein CPB86DRAFT_820549 [Serendipita vermifera]|nr:hypothetical protein CPB86DRAFT_820549 [Serendipita vermifera]
MTQSSGYLSSNIPASRSTQMRSTEEARLSDLCWQLQSDIAKMIPDEKEHEVLNKTKESYNGIIDALHDLTISSQLDLMERLPQEIITKVLLEAIGPSKDMELVLSLTMVSKRWQKFILFKLVLWDMILLDNQHDRDSLVTLQLKLSLDLPLTIQLRCPIQGWDGIRARVLKHRNRVKMILRLGLELKHRELSEQFKRTNST